jgi:hypothetical protein
LLKMAAETGWIGFALFSIAVLKSLPNNFKSMGWEGRAAAAIMYSLLGQALIDGVPGKRALTILFFSAAACTSSWARAKEESISRFVEERHGWSKPVWASVLGLALCIVDIRFEQLKANAMSLASSPNLAVRVAGLKSLSAMEPRSGMLKVQLANVLLVADPGRIGTSLMLLDDAIRLRPRNPILVNLKAELFGMVGDWERSLVWATRATELNLDFPQSRLILAEALLHVGRKKEARAQLILAKQLHDSAATDQPSALIWDQNRYKLVSEALKHVT